MRHITKGREPPSLTQHRAAAFATYGNCSEAVKSDLRDHLLREQGYLCCYCMQRISRTQMRIEHWSAQSDPKHPGLDLAYKNLLGACKGGERTKEEQDNPGSRAGHHGPETDPEEGEDRPPHPYHHCDVHKHDTRITVNPVDPDRRCERTIHYLPDGEIRSDDEAIHRDLHETLNLNLRWMKRNRKQVIDTLVKYLSAKRAEGPWPPGLLEQQIARWQTPKRVANPQRDGKIEEWLEEYCQVAVYYLQKKLNRKK